MLQRASPAARHWSSGQEDGDDALAGRPDIRPRSEIRVPRIAIAPRVNIESYQIVLPPSMTTMLPVM